ncbi:MAG TPA: Hsp70 family protein [Devosia sp.]|jgi:molecular chaperone DnaK|uniref:Hsp70 family protein n=1 Tax=Devosia sp. TaxID=1871048 RepID=UPI002DDCD651|nr:Hsp70 family protein [Devosia sp.]HEV2515811.1 Hsp70 family protein [Devosia sp.]
MGAVVGIDLRTTFSAVAQLDETGRPMIVRTADGSNITPSVVAFSGASVLVGAEARRTIFLDPNTFGRFKRDMGTATKFDVGGTVHTPTSLSALVLKKLVSEAERQIGSISEAVITIPANFANEAREATLEAARMAGINVKHIINEPTAAALYYAQFSGKELAGTFAIYDLGGGTFDVSIVRVTGNDVEVLSTEGVSKLGGDDFDAKLHQLIAAKYKAATGFDLDATEYTRADAETDKKSLSQRETVLVRATGGGGRQQIEVRRREFEDAISTYLAQAEMLCEAAIAGAGVSLDDIQAIILVGGSTRVPAVQQSVAKAFNKPPTTFANPDEVVALGASLYAALKTTSSNLNVILCPEGHFPSRRFNFAMLRLWT